MGNLLDIYGENQCGDNNQEETTNRPVPWSRRIDTQHPLQGGGDFSQNRVHSIPPATDDQDGYLTKEDHRLLSRGNGLISGYATWSGTGLIFDVTACVYKINGIIYNTPAQQITLNPGDLSNPRIDVIYLDTDEQVGVLEGNPAVTPIKPVVDPVTQLELTFVLIGAGATTPSGITQKLVYDENVQPAEWTPSYETFGGPVIDFDSVLTPYTGSKNIAIPSFDGLTKKYIQFTESTPVTEVNDVQFIKFAIWLNVEGTTTISSIRFFNNSNNPVSSPLLITNGQYGYNKDVLNTWQLITIPASDIVFEADSLLSKLRFTFQNGSNVMRIDRIVLQNGNYVPPGLGGVLSFNGRTGHVNSEEGDYKVPVSTLSALPVVGNPAKLYITLDTKFLYHWNGSSYDQIGGGGGGTTATYIEVVIGSAAADALGLVDGETVYTDVTMTNRQVEVERNGLPLPSIPWNGNDHFTKVFAEDHLEFANGLIDGELIKIKIL